MILIHQIHPLFIIPLVIINEKYNCRITIRLDLLQYDVHTFFNMILASKVELLEISL